MRLVWLVHVSDAAVAGHSDVPGMNGRCGWLHGVFAYLAVLFY